MKRILLRVAYEGTRYVGWQTQKQGNAIEDKIQAILERILQEPIHLIGASRTDAGVHSMGNVAVFDTNTSIPASKIVFILNQHLPPDIRVQESKEVAIDFHPRHTLTRKWYRYTIYNHPFMNPLARWNSYFCYYPLDIDKMEEAGRYLEGSHDFKSFCSVKTAIKDTVRQIESIRVCKEGHYIHIDVKGNGFLYNMVRIIVGTLLQVGMNQCLPEKMKDILEARDRQKAGPTAPAVGLTLMEITYPIENY